MSIHSTQWFAPMVQYSALVIEYVDKFDLSILSLKQLEKCKQKSPKGFGPTTIYNFAQQYFCTKKKSALNADLKNSLVQ